MSELDDLAAGVVPSVAVASKWGHLGQPCPGGDETCPGQDGDPCHFMGPGAWPIPAGVSS